MVMYNGDPDYISNTLNSSNTTPSWVNNTTLAGPAAATGLQAKAYNIFGNPFYGFSKEFGPGKMLADPKWAMEQFMARPNQNINTTPGMPFADFMQDVAVGLPQMLSLSNPQWTPDQLTGGISNFLQDTLRAARQGTGGIAGYVPGADSNFMTYQEMAQALANIGSSTHGAGVAISGATKWDEMMTHLLPFLQSAGITALDPFTAQAAMRDLERKTGDYSRLTNTGSATSSGASTPWEFLKNSGWLSQWFGV